MKWNEDKRKLKMWKHKNLCWLAWVYRGRARFCKVPSYIHEVNFILYV